MAKEVIKKRAVGICLGCIQEFKYADLAYVKLYNKFDLTFQSFFCEKCIKNENFPEHTGFEIGEPVAKARVTKPKTKVTPKKKVVTKKKVTSKNK